VPARIRKQLRKAGRKLEYPLLWARAARGGRALRRDFDGVRAWLTFVGYPRTGSSLVAALLDAHSECIVSDQLHALRFVRYGFGRDALFWLVLERSRALAREGRGANGYRYDLAGLHQGRYTGLRVIGDKRGDTSALRLCERPRLLAQLRRRVRCPLRFVHTVRNPFDMVATMFHQGRRRNLEHALGQFEALSAAMIELGRNLPSEELHVLRLEDLVAAPAAELARLCDFLGVGAPSDWLRTCDAFVWRQPNRTRKEVDWSPGQLERIRAQLERNPFLAGYGFDA
jgi:hypothetical protein